MARKIAATPILTGKEAREFEKRAKANMTKCASKKKVEKAIRSFTKVYYK